ncbi:MAG TPA: tetratricopeptide repeat protein, partial [Candidatus Polarisedimenticolia bacterium]|nr:tetratricopeptide repeat protein [Candidatus Polarisedimenticolia bacterium]
AIIVPDPGAAPPPPAPPDSAADIQAKIHTLWFERKLALESSDTVLAQARVEELRAYMGQEGITADRDVARGFAYEGYENLREGNYERAREAFNLARSFDPYLPQAQMGYAWSLLRSGRGVVTFVNEYLPGIRLAWSQFLADEIAPANFVVVASIAVLFSSVMFSLVVVIRCQGRVRHDLTELARRPLGAPAARVFSWAVLALPLLVWAGGLWAILFWLAVSFRYMRAAEKLVATSVFVMIGLSPLGVAAILDRFQASTDPDVRTVVDAMQAGYNPETARRLRQVVRAHEAGPELHLLLGSSYAKGDLLGEAFDEYQRVLELSPSSTPALVNTGNIYFRLGEHAQAVAHYKQAAGIQPDLVSAYWNLYLAQTELLHFSEAEASLARARQLDAGQVGRLLARKKEGGVLLVEEPASLPAIKRELREAASGGDPPLEALGSPVSLAAAVALSGALLLTVIGRRAEACARCGRAWCGRCAVTRDAGRLCSRCVHLFVKKDGITADVRAEELARLGRRDRVTAATRRLLSVLLPGSGQIMAGRLAVGLPVLMSYTCALMFLLARERLLLSPRVPVSDLPPPGVVIAVAAMAGLWIAGNTVSLKSPSSAVEAPRGA